MDAYIVSIIAGLILWSIGTYVMLYVGDRKPTLLLKFSVLIVFIPFINLVCSLVVPYYCTLSPKEENGYNREDN